MKSTYESERFRLRDFEPGDLAAVYENFSDPRVMKYYDAAPLGKMAEAERLLAEWRHAEHHGTGLRWAIADRNSNRLIGTCGFHALARRHRRAEIGYELHPDWWGRGVMSEVLPLALEHAFRKLQLNRLAALILPANRPSIALVRKFGFRREGLLREFVRVADRRLDMESYSLLQADYNARSVAAQRESLVI